VNQSNHIQILLLLHNPTQHSHTHTIAWCGFGSHCESNSIQRQGQQLPNTFDLFSHALFTDLLLCSHAQWYII